MMTCPLHMQVPLTVSSPPWQFSASVRTQVPPFPLPPNAVPPLQITGSSALRVGSGGGSGGGTGGLTAAGSGGALAALATGGLTAVGRGGAGAASATQRPLSGCALI